MELIKAILFLLSYGAYFTTPCSWRYNRIAQEDITCLYNGHWIYSNRGTGKLLRYSYPLLLLWMILVFWIVLGCVVIPLTNVFESRPGFMRLLPPQHKSSLSPCEGEKEVSCK